MKFAIILSSVISVLFLSSASYADPVPLILSGKVSSSAKQTVVAPRGSSWNIQLQWMEEEGKVVQQGDLVVVFDGAAEQSRLEQSQETLERLLLEYKQLDMRLQQELTEAQGRLKVAKMQVAKAQIEVSVNSDTLSDYQKGQNQMVLERALLEKIKAEEALKKSDKQRISGLEKKNLDILKERDDIQYYENLLTKLNVKAKHTGPVTYANHPWNGTKMASGMNVQPSWTILDVQATSDYQVESFVHEIDALNLSQGQQVSLHFDAFAEQTFSGTIASVGSQAESKPQMSNATYFPVIITFDSVPDRTLFPGMSVRISSHTKFDVNSEVAVSKPQTAPTKKNLLTIPAELMSLQTVTIGPPSIRRMWQYKIQRLVSENKIVKTGDMLVKFDGQELRTKMLTRQSELDAASKELEKLILEDTATQEDLELALAEASMNEDKARRKVEITVSSRSEVERRKQEADYTIMQALKAQALQRLNEHKTRRIVNQQVQDARIMNLQTRVDEIKDSINKLTITSPSDGIVIFRDNGDGDKPAVGDTVFMGNSLLDVPSLNNLAIKMEVDESDTNKVRIGQSVDVVLNAYPERIFTGTITSKGQAYRNKSQRNQKVVFDAWVTLDDLDLTIMRPGMQANVNVKALAGAR
jgi:HlyD family secretion protein